jgi:hypothetical protein
MSKWSDGGHGGNNKVKVPYLALPLPGRTTASTMCPKGRNAAARSSLVLLSRRPEMYNSGAEAQKVRK